MKHLIILISLLTVPFISQGQDHSGEYKVVCERIEGCPVVNGTCPTCTLIKKNPRRITNKEIDEWGKKMKKKMGYDSSFFKKDKVRKQRSGWGWEGATWNELWILY